MSVAKRKPSQFFLSPVNLGGLAILIFELLVKLLAGAGAGGTGCVTGGVVGALAGLGESGRMSLVPSNVHMTMVPMYPTADWKGSIISPIKVCRKL